MDVAHISYVTHIHFTQQLDFMITDNEMLNRSLVSQMLQKKSRLWRNIAQHLQNASMIGKSLLLRCENHPENCVEATKSADFQNVPEGEVCSKDCSVCNPHLSNYLPRTAFGVFLQQSFVQIQTDAELLGPDCFAAFISAVSSKPGKSSSVTKVKLLTDLLLPNTKNSCL